MYQYYGSRASLLWLDGIGFPSLELNLCFLSISWLSVKQPFCILKKVFHSWHVSSQVNRSAILSIFSLGNGYLRFFARRLLMRRLVIHNSLRFRSQT
jgi:hypothetical protein